MNLTGRFPGEWLVSVTVTRSGGTDRKGNPLPATEHTVDDCLVSTQTSAEEALARSDRPDTTAWLYAPAGADFTSTDTVTVPPSPKRLWPDGVFTVNGRPDVGPLGVRVQLREA